VLDRTYHVVAYSPEPERFAVIVQDITERTRAEEALRESERAKAVLLHRLNEAQRLAAIGSWEWDLRTDEVWWSDEIYRLFGVTPDQFRPSFEANARFIHTDDLARYREAFEHSLRTGDRLELGLRLLPGDGGLRECDARGEVVTDGSGQPILFVGFLIDVTERNRLAAALLQSQKMETVGRLAGGIAHDFNNLLGVVLGNAELARMDLEGADPRSEALIEIEDAARKGAALTRQLLAFSRQQVVSPEVLEIAAVVAEMEGMLRRLIGEGITLTVIAGEPPARVRADRAQVGQILLNLVVNARDAMPGGGTLRIETGLVELDADDADRPASLAPGRYAILAVTDTGAGIDEATRARLFEPFFTTKGPGAGSGLGLSTAQGIARQGGGDVVCVGSNLGDGSSFALYLPATDEPLPAPPAPTPAVPVATGTGTILLVEDDPGVRRLAERNLASAGYTVLTAADGVEAIRVLAVHPGSVELVVTDVIMPTMGGRELAGRVAGARPGTRVLFTSGYPGDILTDQGTLPPGAPFIGKPYTADELIATVREVLAGRA
jgi:two-component system, cell cycle sensor histidine kinase and response regulator CckA